MQILLRSAAVLFAAVFLMSAGLIQPWANTCQTVLVWNSLQSKWIADCRGSCSSTACQLIQAGNPVGNNIPLACGCTDGGDPFADCAGRFYVDEEGEVVLNPAPGCIVPEESCGLGWVCKDVKAPTPSDTTTTTWDPCVCSAP